MRLVATQPARKSTRTSGAGLFAPIARAFTATLAWWARRQTMLKLGQLSDAALKDIGLTRDEIEPVAREVAMGIVRRHR